MPFYAPEQLRMIDAEYATVETKWQRLFIQYTHRAFSDARARERATGNGTARQAITLCQGQDRGQRQRP